MDDLLTTSETITQTSEIPFATRFSHFLTRTSTQYNTTDLDYLYKRGIENRLLESLLIHLPDGAIIAGGFALNIVVGEKKASDIDFFFTSEAAFNETLDLFKNPPDDDDAWAYKGYKISDEVTKNSRYISLKHDTLPAVQLLKMVWYDSPDHVIDTFDFTIAQFAFTNKAFVFNGEAMLDIAKKRLILHRMQFPASTLRRLVKYTQKGYYACPGSLVTICEAIQKFTGVLDVNQVVYVD
jgi:hypothetical protein